MKKAGILITFMSVALLSGCQTDTMFTLTNIQPIKPFKVKLVVVGNELTNDKVRNNNCSAFADRLKKGCFVADKGDVLELEFKLKKRAEDADWRFTRLMICAGTTKPSDASQCKLDKLQQADWLVIGNYQLALLPDNGTVDLTGFSPTLLVFTVLDINAHADDYTYNIEACKEGSTEPDDCVWMDPGGTNKGR